MFQEVTDRPLQTKPVTSPLDDPRWALVHQLDGLELLRIWLGTKDANEAYDWGNPATCLMTQFCLACRPTDEQLNQIGHRSAYIAKGPDPETIDGFRSRDRYWTFGQALARAREG